MANCCNVPEFGQKDPNNVPKDVLLSLLTRFQDRQTEGLRPCVFACEAEGGNELELRPEHNPPLQRHIFVQTRTLREDMTPLRPVGMSAPSRETATEVRRRTEEQSPTEQQPTTETTLTPTAPTSPSDSITFTDRVRMAGPAIGFALPTPPFLQGDSPRRLLSQAPRLSPIPEIGSSQEAETNTSTQQSEPRLGSPPSLVPEYDSSPPSEGEAEVAHNAEVAHSTEPPATRNGPRPRPRFGPQSARDPTARKTGLEYIAEE